MKKDYLIPVVRVEFHELPDFILTQVEFEERGGWRGFIKEYHINIKEVKKLHYEMISPKDFPKSEWEG